MATLKTKYNLKQTVYNAYCTNQPYSVPCEDCDGTGYWKIANTEKTIGCHTCNKEDGWYNTPGKITKYKYFPGVQKLTIGQVRVTIGHQAEIRYMCKESGLGSGTLWSEKSLTDNYDLAVEASNILAEKKNAGEDVDVENLYVQMGGK